MEMTLESLTAAGISAELAKQVLDAHKKAVEGQYVTKTRFDEVNNALKIAKDTTAERDKQINELKRFQGSQEELQKKVKELEDANKAKDAEMEKALAAERKSNAMKLALTGKAQDADLVLTLIDAEKVSVDSNGKLIGFDDQLKSIQKEKAFLFKPEGDGKPGADGGKPGVHLAGKTPEDGTGGGDGGGDKGGSFGERLAKQQNAYSGQAARSMEYYFGGAAPKQAPAQEGAK
jgi:hypothetical protein